MSNVIAFSPRAEVRVRKLVGEGKIAWTKHAKERMKERGITIQQILNCLSKGRIIEGPFQTLREGGGEEVTIEKMTAGEQLRVAACLKPNETVLVITAFYCD